MQQTELSMLPRVRRAAERRAADSHGQEAWGVGEWGGGGIEKVKNSSTTVIASRSYGGQ